MSDWFVEPVDYFPQYDRYWYEHPEYGRLQYDEAVRLAMPPSDQIVNQQVNRIAGGSDAWGNFSNDVILNADPLVQPYLVELLDMAEGDLAGAMSAFNDSEFQDSLRGRIGRTAWDDWEQNADAMTRGQLRRAGSGQEKDEIVVDAISRALENLLAQGAPSVARNQGLHNQLWGEQGGRPIGPGGAPGGAAGGGGQLLEGPGFGSGEAQDFVRGGGYVGPGSQFDDSRERAGLLKQLTSEDIEGLTGAKGAQVEALRNYTQKRTRPTRRPKGSMRRLLDNARWGAASSKAPRRETRRRNQGWTSGPGPSRSRHRGWI